jgi:ribosome-interacting GTPase 1
MPTNLPPECQKLEEEYRAAKSTPEKITALEAYLTAIPKHKGTDHLRADLRRKLSKLKASPQAKKGTAKQQSAFHIDKEGAGQVALIGPANGGKSALVAALTNASPEVSEAPMTTWTPTPGMMAVDNIQIQLIDTPSLSREFVDPEMFNMLRRVDLILLVVDVQTDPVRQIKETVDILHERRIIPLNLQDQYTEELALTAKPFLVLANKTDDESINEVFDIFCELLEGDWPLLPVSAATGRNLDLLEQTVFDQLGIIRIYSKIPGKPADMSAPFAARKGCTVEEFAEKVHKDFYENLKSARVWGSATFDGQMVGRDHVLQDGDVVELRI